MKVKEIPLSLFRSLWLRSLSPSQLLAEGKKEVPVVISLTTIDSRLNAVDLVIRSLMEQTVRPKKILLWINEASLPHIPKKLAYLQGALFEIRTTPLFSSHKKLIHSMALYPDSPVITCDDDLMYRNDWLTLLYNESSKHPNTIIANQTRTITKDPSGAFLSYRQWPVSSNLPTDPRRILPVGAEGVLYPPHALDLQYDQQALFMKLAPKADDLWFKSMSLLKGTPSRLAEKRPKPAIPIMGSQKSSLKDENIKKDLNSKQWAALVAHFKLDLGS